MVMDETTTEKVTEKNKICVIMIPSKNKTMEVNDMKYVCDVCGWEYDEEAGAPDLGIEPGSKFEDLPDDFACPLCSVGKDMFSEA